jgi:hypothetical protein
MEDAMTFANTLHTRDLAAFAFYQGAHGMPLDQTLREVATSHEQDRAKLEEESVRKQKPLEAVIHRLERQQPRIDAAWSELLRRIGYHAPAVTTAYLIAFLGIGALVIDAILLGPGLDAIGIADPVFQFFAAFGLAALSSLIFHLAHETFEQNRLTFETRITWRGLGVFAVVALLGWGVLRGLQVKFAADVNQNPLGQFLGDHPMLAAIFFCFVTLAAPLVGAAAIHYASPRIYEWLTWKRAKQAHEELHAALSDAQKKLETERATLNHQFHQLKARQESWHATAAQYHQRGRVLGSRQAPHWLVLLKSTAWSLGGLVLGSLLGPFLSPLYFALPGGAWIAAFLYYRHRRFHPTHDQFKQQENTHFAVSTERTRIVLPATPKLLLPPEDEK